MQTNKKPIKRSAALAPLSREHHDALLLVWKIRHGLKNDIELGRIAGYCQWFWQHLLQQHFKMEEKVLIPFLGIGSAMASRLLSEHADIRDLVKAVSVEPETPTLENLATVLNDHIRFEERFLFNEVESLATPEQLQQMSEDLQEEKLSGIWEDEFWTIKK